MIQLIWACIPAKIKTYIKLNFSHLITLWVEYGKKQVERQRLKLKKVIFDYYQGTNDEEVKKILSFLDKHEVQMMPYEFTEQYKAENITVYTDHASEYPYVLLDNKKVFFPKGAGSEEIKISVATALMEQDDNSPHKYLSDTTNIAAGDTAVLIGASDGIFCLRIIEKAKKVYLFEPDKRWAIPLTLTLNNYISKVEIIGKYVSDKDDDMSVKLDSFFNTRKERVNFIQADIEGFEKKLLLGAGNVLSQSDHLKISICTYHKGSDFSELSDMLLDHGFRIRSSLGYMIMWMQIPCKPPYLRKGVLYADK